MRPALLAMLSACAVLASFAGCGRSGPLLDDPGTSDDDDDDDDDGSTVTLNVAATAGGRVTSQPAGIDCGTDCSETFAIDTTVQLTAFLNTGAAFVGWDGACADEASVQCVLTLDSSATAGARFVASGGVWWARRAGGNSDDQFRAVALASNGDLLATGSFVAPGDFTSRTAYQAAAATLTGYGGDDIAVARFDAATGETVWSRAWGGTGDEQGNGVAANAAGRMFLGGEFDATITLGGPTNLVNAGNSDGFLASFRARDGVYDWQLQLGAGGDDRVTAVSSYGGRVSSGGNQQNAISEEWLLPDPDFDGSLDFSGGSSRVNGVAGNGTAVYLIGTKSGPTLAEGTTIGGPGGEDAFVVRGTPVTGGSTIAWAVPLGSTGDDAGHAIAVSAAGDFVAVTGSFEGTGDFGAFDQLANGEDAFVVKLAATGAVQWSAKIGNAGDDEGMGIAIGPNGDVYVAGILENETNGSDDAFVARLDGTTGALKWLDVFGGTGDEVALGIVANAEGVFVAGSFQGTVDVGGITLTGPGREAFLLRLQP